ncbi:MAG: phosphoethanolamine transferase [Akkermansiaceae bacterium]|nr:phosphoethanolamine transferase [Akkermansiaceae bacterium]
MSRLSAYWSALSPILSRLLFFIVLLAFPVHAARVWLRQWDVPFELTPWGMAGIGALVLSVLVMVVGCFLRKRTLLPAGALWGGLLLAALFVSLGHLLAFASLWQLHFPLLLTMGCICLTWGLLRRWALLFWGAFMAVEMLQFIGFHQYGSRINSLVLAETFEASMEEAMAYLTPLNLALMVPLLLLVVLFIWLQLRFLRHRSRMELLNTGLLFCGLCGAFASCLRPAGQTVNYYWPACEVPELVTAVTEAFTINEATINQVEGLDSPADKHSSLPLLSGKEGVVLVLHIGESIRADRMSINGYERPTTPFLASCGQQLINFPSCISAACDTCQAQIAILTNGRRNINDRSPGMQPTVGSVIDLFAKHDFSVYSFFGRRCAQKLKYDRVVQLLTRQSEARFNAPGYPWTSVEQVKTVLAENAGKNLFFFINNEGSHTPFNHYDRENPPFTPTTPDFQNPAAQAEEVNNAYDNTIHYTDEFFRRIAALLKGRPFVYVYVSDHGEYLGHDGRWGRGFLGQHPGLYHATDGCKVGMFVLYSPEFASLRPHFAQSLEQLRENSRLTVAHEHIFHTLLGLFGVKTPFYEGALDLTSSTVQPYTGPQPPRHEN